MTDTSTPAHETDGDLVGDKEQTRSHEVRHALVAEEENEEQENEEQEERSEEGKERQK